MYEKETLEAISLLKSMISIPSFSRDEKNVADFLENFIKNKGFLPKRIENNILLYAENFDNSKKTLLLNSHIDTVKPVSGWNFDPFISVEIDEKLIGLGSNDAGASVVTLLESFFILSNKNLSFNVVFLASAEEEISGKNGIGLVLNQLHKVDLAIVGEPTEMKMAVAEKGLMVLDCTTYGKAGHAARNEGENAIYKALKDIEWFKNYKFDKISEFLGEVKMSVTQVNAGTQHNVIPDECKFVVDVRSNELYSNQELFALIKENVSCDVVPRSTRLSSSKTPDYHSIIELSRKFNIELFGSPTLSDQSLIPFASVKIGPGKSERSHTADEFVYLKEIENAIVTYVKLLENLEI